MNVELKQKFGSLIEQIDSADIISFDIFDTLLLRPFVHPYDVFNYLGKFFKDSKFKELRIMAEELARKKCDNKEEITLDDIYGCLPNKYLKYKDAEKFFEKQILTVNNEMLKLFNYAKSLHKKIIIVSDMYLSKNFLEQLLLEKGFLGYEELFVSSEIGSRKSSGNLFKHICQKLEIIEPNTVLHIGDNEISDYNVPIQLGFKAYHYKPIVKIFFDKNNDIKRIYNSFNNPIYSLIIGSYIIIWHNEQLYLKDDFFAKIGYLLAGILVFSYVKFICANCRSMHLSDIFFVARDGFVLKKIFDLIETNIKSHYVYAPRTIRIFGFGEGLDNNNYLDAFLEKYPELAVLKANETNILKSINNNLGLITGKMDAIKNDYKKYLSKIPIIGNNIAIVDLGSGSASAQRLLIKYFKDKIKLGFYWGINHKNKLPYKEFTDGKSKLICEELIEFLISSPEYPIESFENGEVIYHSPTLELSKNSQYFKMIYPYEIELAQNLIQYTKNFEVPITYSFICEYYNNYISNMPLKEIKRFKNITWQPDITHNHSISMMKIINNAKKNTNITKQNLGMKIKKLLRKLHLKRSGHVS